PFLLHEVPAHDHRNNDGQDHRYIEGVGGVLVGDVHVHAVNAGYQYGKGEHNGNGGKALHHQVEVIGNDAGKGIHGAAEDVGVHVGHFQGLGGVYDQVVQEFLLIIVEAQEIGALQLHQHQLVAAEGGHKVYQAFLDTHQVQQLLVPVTVIQLLLQLVAALVDLLEVVQEVHYHLFKYLQHHHVPFFRVAVVKGVQELFNGCVVKGIYDNDLVVGENNHDRDGDVIGVAFVDGVIFRGGFDHDQLYIVLQLKAGLFVDIQGVGEEVQGNIQLFRQVLELCLLERRCNIHPGAVFRLMDLYR